MSEQEEKLGRLIDRLDNLAHALKLNIPANVHIDAIRGSLPDIVVGMKEAFKELTGKDPWEE